MRLTIIIPTIERDTLKRAEESVENQTVKTELFVYPDRMRLGPSRTRNLAARMIKTPWVGYLDDDDTLDLHYHEWLDTEYKGYDVVMFQAKYPDGLTIPGHTDPRRLRLNWMGISFALKTDLAKRYLFEDMVGEDFELIQRLIKDGYKIKISDKIAYYIKP